MTATAQTPWCRPGRAATAGSATAPPSGPAGRTGCAGTSSATAWCGSSRPRASRWSPCRGSTWSSTGASWSPIVGASGSGKSTLLNILSGLDTPTAGIARVADYDLLALSAEATAELPAAAGRVRLAADRPQPAAVPDARWRTSSCRCSWPARAAARPARRARELLDLVGVGYCADRRPGQLSGGEQQRVAVAVAVANDPEVLFADEPTGELDEATGAEVFARAAHHQRRAGRDHRGRHPRPRRGRRRSAGPSRSATAGPPPRYAGPPGSAPTATTELVSEEYAVLDRAGGCSCRPRSSTRSR